MIKRFVLSLLSLLCVLGATRIEAAGKPNIVLIMLDDAGYGDLSCYGQKKFSTPHVDKLALEGMKFTQHYSGSTVCAPTRSVLMTGLHTGHAHVRGNKEHKPIGQEPMAASAVTVAELLKSAGYATGAFGKWGLGYPGSEGDPLKQGFDRFYGYNCQRIAHNYYPDQLQDDDHNVELPAGTYAHDLIMEKSLQWIREQNDGPFFCYLPITIPHAAMHVPEEDAAPFRKQFPEFENVVGKYAGPNVTNPPAMFAGMMTRMDRGIGELMALLKELKIDDNTIVLFTSDNGPHQEGGHKPDFFNSNGGLTGYKRDLTEGGIRTPLIVRWPGKVAAGATSDLISAHWDLLPTICELAGVKSPTAIDGISMVPTLLQTSTPQRRHEALYWEFHEQGGKRALRFGEHGQWKAIQLNLHKKPSEISLYDLSTDPTESTDVAGQHPEVVAEASRLFTVSHVAHPLWRFPFDDAPK